MYIWKPLPIINIYILYIFYIIARQNCVNNICVCCLTNNCFDQKFIANSPIGPNLDLWLCCIHLTDTETTYPGWSGCSQHGLCWRLGNQDWICFMDAALRRNSKTFCAVDFVHAHAQLHSNRYNWLKPHLNEMNIVLVVSEGRYKIFQSISYSSAFLPLSCITFLVTLSL